MSDQRNRTLSQAHRSKPHQSQGTRVMSGWNLPFRLTEAGWGLSSSSETTSFAAIATTTLPPPSFASSIRRDFEAIPNTDLVNSGLHLINELNIDSLPDEPSEHVQPPIGTGRIRIGRHRPRCSHRKNKLSPLQTDAFPSKDTIEDAQGNASATVVQNGTNAANYRTNLSVGRIMTSCQAYSATQGSSQLADEPETSTSDPTWGFTDLGQVAAQTPLQSNAVVPQGFCAVPTDLLRDCATPSLPDGASPALQRPTAAYQESPDYGARFAIFAAKSHVRVQPADTVRGRAIINQHNTTSRPTSIDAYTPTNSPTASAGSSTARILTPSTGSSASSTPPNPETQPLLSDIPAVPAPASIATRTTALVAALDTSTVPRSTTLAPAYNSSTNFSSTTSSLLSPTSTVPSAISPAAPVNPLTAAYSTPPTASFNPPFAPAAMRRLRTANHTNPTPQLHQRWQAAQAGPVPAGPTPEVLAHNRALIDQSNIGYRGLDGPGMQMASNRRLNATARTQMGREEMLAMRREERASRRK